MDERAFEENRIREVYARRDSVKGRLYSWTRHDTLYMNYRKICAWAKAFKFIKATDLNNLEILDIGCGSGEWLRSLIEWGATASGLHGIDILPDRIEAAQSRSIREIDYKVSNGCSLPYSDKSMDVVGVSTVFSSMLEKKIREDLAKEIERVLKPGGWAIIFDFSISKITNPDTVGIPKKEIVRLFPGLKLEKKIHLITPPPLLRILPDRLLFLGFTLECLFPFLCSHRLYLLHKN